MTLRLPHTTLEQWRVLQAVVDSGGFAQGAGALHRSQSAVSYTLARLQSQLGLPLLQTEGRRARLTATGAALLQEAQPLIEGLLRLEDRARALQQGWEAVVRLAVDSMFPTPRLLTCLAEFSAQCPDTQVELREVILSGADDALFGGEADLIIGSRVPEGFLGDRLLDVEFVAVAHPSHPLHQLGRPLTGEDLARQLQVVIRDSGTREPRDEGWLGASRRWTVSTPETAVALLSSGFGFAWQARHRIEEALAQGMLLPLNLAAGQVRHAPLYLVLRDAELAGPATLALARILRAAA